MKITAVTMPMTTMPVEVPVDVGLVDDVADQIGAERGAAGGDRHQAERPDVALPVPRRLLDQQPAHQRGRAVGIGETATGNTI